MDADTDAERNKIKKRFIFFIYAKPELSNIDIKSSFTKGFSISC